MDPAQADDTGIDEYERKFRSEIQSLEWFSGRIHSHLVTLLASYRQKGKYYLLFPYARDDLERHWTKNKTVPQDHRTAIWFARQLCGLMGAVNLIHNPSHLKEKYGRHGDIKAENVLLYDHEGDDLGILVLTDMGFTCVHRAVSRSTDPNHKVGRTTEYQAPEFEAKGGTINRASDIWALGCLFLDLVLWFIWGESAISKFGKNREMPDLKGIGSWSYYHIARMDGNVGSNVTKDPFYVVSVKLAVSKVRLIYSLTSTPIESARLITLLKVHI